VQPGSLHYSRMQIIWWGNVSLSDAVESPSTEIFALDRIKVENAKNILCYCTIDGIKKFNVCRFHKKVIQDLGELMRKQNQDLGFF
jgi:hypothetical protein